MICTSYSAGRDNSTEAGTGLAIVLPVRGVTESYVMAGAAAPAHPIAASHLPVRQDRRAPPAASL